jgi:hypothetical protein
MLDCTGGILQAMAGQVASKSMECTMVSLDAAEAAVPVLSRLRIEGRHY